MIAPAYRAAIHAPGSEASLSTASKDVIFKPIYSSSGCAAADFGVASAAGSACCSSQGCSSAALLLPALQIMLWVCLQGLRSRADWPAAQRPTAWI